MTNAQKYKLQNHEQNMREHAIAISNHSVKMEDINQFAARNALKGIIEYLQDALNDIPDNITIGELVAKGELP